MKYLYFINYISTHEFQGIIKNKPERMLVNSFLTWFSFNFSTESLVHIGFSHFAFAAVSPALVPDHRVPPFSAYTVFETAPFRNTAIDVLWPVAVLFFGIVQKALRAFLHWVLVTVRALIKLSTVIRVSVKSVLTSWNQKISWRIFIGFDVINW